MPERSLRAALTCAWLAVPLLGADLPAGLLFHASFDSGVEAERAVGRADPYLFPQPDARARNTRHRALPGAFGRAATAVMGSYDALGNVLPERGTVAFFARLVGADVGEYPLRVQTLDSYYWRSYLVAAHAERSTAAWVADEAFRVDTSVLAQPGTRPSPDRWRHYAIAWDQAYGVSLYVDGELAASSWGKRSWLSRGVDPAELRLAWADGNVAYDELYVFDRALSAAQIRALARQNHAPAARELPAVPFDARRRANRLAEFGWDEPVTRARLTLDARGRGALSVRQVLPREARAQRAEAGAVFDGRLGQGWPARSLVGYEIAGGNGLSVQLDEDFDTLWLEGRFAGRVYAGRHLLEPRSTPLHAFDASVFRSRWRPEQPQRGWLSFFWNATSSSRENQIAELSFFRSAPPPSDPPARGWFLAAPAEDRVAAQIAARFAEEDRETLSATQKAPPRSRRVLPGLRFHHVLLPARDADWVLRGLRIELSLAGELDGLPLQVELRDPLQPGRRLAVFDFELAAPAGVHSTNLDLALDVGPRIVPADRPLWVVLVAGRAVELVLGDPQAPEPHPDLRAAGSAGRTRLRRARAAHAPDAVPRALRGAALGLVRAA